jgi:hypothetical protein
MGHFAGGGNCIRNRTARRLSLTERKQQRMMPDAALVDGGSTMSNSPPLSADRYQASYSSRCWSYTPLDQPWARIAAMVHADGELCAVVEQEEKLGPVPEWAQQIVVRCINCVPPCGHYTFPRPQLQVLDAIGSAAPPAFFLGCYTVDPARKAQLQDVCLCLDAWLADADPADVARELQWRSERKIDWAKVCADLWQILGQHEEWKELMVQRIVFALRADVKQSPWEDDRGDKHGRDQFLGSIRVDRHFAYVQSPLARYDAGRSPQFMRLLARLDEIWPKTLPTHRAMLEEWWPCAPKSLRFLERMLWAIGRGRLGAGKADWPSYLAEQVPGFLQCEDTYPDQHLTADWWPQFCASLDAWWQGQTLSTPTEPDVRRRLGEPTDVKRWLVRLYRHKLRKLEENGEQFTRLVRADRNGRRGSARLSH